MLSMMILFDDSEDVNKSDDNSNINNEVAKN